MSDTNPRPILEIAHLEVDYRMQGRTIRALRDVSLSLRAGEKLGIVGESGSGKSTLAYAILASLGGNGMVSGGTIRFEGRDLTGLDEAAMRDIRGARIAIVPQDPPTALNPTIPVGEQIAETLRRHKGMTAAAATARALELMAEVNLPDPGRLAGRYPYQLSGGQQQRVAIAMTFACDPTLLILDEPTTGLDVTSESRVLALIEQMVATYRTAVLFISHNLGVVAKTCDRIAVMYAGELLEVTTAAQLIAAPRHPYTAALLACLPKIGLTRDAGPLPSIPGELPDLSAALQGCIFRDRCSHARRECAAQPVPLESFPNGQVRCLRWREIDPAPVAPDLPALPVQIVAPTGAPPGRPLLDAVGLRVHYAERRGLGAVVARRPRRVTRAVDGITLSVGRGRTLAVVGESGCGKTSLGRAILGLTPADDGALLFDGRELARSIGDRTKALRMKIQTVFQNPDSTLNPARSIRSSLTRPLTLSGTAGKAVEARALELLAAVRLPPAMIERSPAHLSGGQKQRVAIARAVATDPELIVLDEPLSALDVSVQATVINLLIELQRQTGCTYVFISHDLSLVSYFADRIAVMYLGRLCEVGTPDQVLAPPYHPYTEALLAAIPLAQPGLRQRPVPISDTVTPFSGRGCPFAGRCPRQLGALCETETPPVRAFGDHHIACHIEPADLAAVAPVIEWDAEREGERDTRSGATRAAASEA